MIQRRLDSVAVSQVDRVLRYGTGVVYGGDLELIDGPEKGCPVEGL